MTAAGMVMMMQVGFLLLEAGWVRSKNSINVAQKNLLDFVFGVVAFAAFGFMVAFGSSGFLPIGVDGSLFFLWDVDGWEAGFFVFQVMFCATAATIVSGAVAERMRLVAYVFGSIFLSALLYPVFAHWVWGSSLQPNGGSFLGNLGFVDFAGSTVVHATGGWVALAACMVLGARRGRFGPDGRPIRIAGHSPVLTSTGALLLFFGWIGFNGGSTFAANDDVAPIVLNTVLAGGMGTCIGYVHGFIKDRVVLPEKSLSGLLGGLVAVTAGCHILEPGAALLIGAIGAFVAVAGNEWVEAKLKVDDAVGAIGVHAFAGVAGTIGLAFLAPAHLLPAGNRFDQAYIQIFGSVLNFYWAFGIGYLFFRLLDRFMAIRVNAADEEVGLNIAEHGTRLGIGHVEDALNQLVSGRGNLGHRLQVDPGDEAENLSRLFNRLMDNIQAEEESRQEIQKLKRDHEEAERVAALAAATTEAILMHEAGVIIDGNEQLAKLVERPLQELIGSSIYSILSKEDYHRVLDLNDPARDGIRKFTVITSGSERVPVEARGRDIVYGGRTIRVSALVDLRERLKAEQHIRHLALHDPLTGLPNRTLFTETLVAALERALNGGHKVTALLVDLDHFKDINDLHGHPAGDTVIKETARRLLAHVGAGGMAARLGGDEFAILLEGELAGDALDTFCSALVQAFREPFDTGRGEQVVCRVSIGAASCPQDATTLDELIGRADVALYNAKKAGRNTWRVFRPGMDELIEKRRALEADIERGLPRGEFLLYLQPRVAAPSGTISGYEALLRWNHPVRGMIQPGDFIPVAEVSGKIIALGQFVLEEACRLLQGLEERLHVSVNVSPVQFRHPDFVRDIQDLLRRSTIDPSRLELEITESVLIEDDDHATAVLDQLKTLGLRIALDDFGTGYSSLSYLSRYPFDVIKIDRSFVDALGREDNATAIVRSIIDLGTALGLHIVAEGVETLDQARYLADAGCDELQGYLLGRPAAPELAIRQIDRDVARALRQAALSRNQVPVLDAAAGE
ncbi:EAL domain-containing protein [Peteryoungia desertarenae]|uniref:EAL domain-containing protein n=2 Tax=Peteryoungia desertarenae TaxID=1813451 RepID=A0ABX6QSA6_9HYPH|nr:EAL domain-containing protein [Peteryoungia desertarenae]